MKKLSNIRFTKNLPKYLLVYAVVFVIGIVMLFVSGANLDIQFKGGSQATYSYAGSIDLDKVQTTVEGSLSKKVSIKESTSYTDAASKKFVISVAGNSTIDAKQMDTLLTDLQKAFKDNDIKQAEVISVSPTIGATFFWKSLVAVIIASVLIVIYVAIRFRKIGGVSAALFALLALFIDVIVAYFSCIIFGLTIDSNFMAVVLILLGYSLNASIVIFDRVRENRRIFGREKTLSEIVDISDNQCISRNIMTTLTTFAAVMTILVVGELNGLTSIRSLTVPMACGIVSGAFSSMCVGPVIWGRWADYRSKKTSKKKK